MDTFQSVCICHMQYHYTITNYANPSVLAFNIWSVNFEVGLTAVITFMVQAFFARRAWYFTKRVGSRFTTTRKTQLLGAFVGFLALSALGFGIGSFSMTWVLGRFSRFIEYRWLVGIWLGAAAFCDIVIVYMLSTALVTQRTGFGRTDALINKLLRYTINTGLLTSLVAVADVLSFCTMNNMVHLGFNFVLGKMYTNTLLATLNARDTEPVNVVHVEEGSYNLKERQQNASHGQIRFNRPPGVTSSQDRAEPVIHLHTDTAVEVSNIETRRRSSQDQVYQSHQVVVIQHGNAGYNPDKDIEFDADSVESFKKGRS
ncbi:transmembrane protein, putative [Rhizoctonia solani AG-3 Rhs1AP]|uniref:Transmembrane protein, putative n=1 Tax=Rhizoctonia solani AG-3 Rhs1AP TaxID=1086054 RepID=X8J8V2_9AGAM|nr:transmembrane protein, putative [Rhizoctonia solani AG-3 Rhs1AP]